MTDIKSIAAKNIAALRQAQGMTQLELAERLNYSDKAVSKWERGESMPDIAVLVELADLFGVTLDQLVRDEAPKPPPCSCPSSRLNKSTIAGACLLLVWLVAVLSFIILRLTLPHSPAWLAFIWAVPVTTILWLVLNSIWFSPRRNYLIISLLMWSALAAIHLTLLQFFSDSLWLIYLLGIPGQAIILLWSRFRQQRT